MRISWLAPDVIAAARSALRARSASWDDHFTPDFEPPPPPDGVVIRNWARVTEHVARAERVSEVVREEGIEAARERFAESPHAIELATLAAAALEAEELQYGLVCSVLARDIDDLVAYAPFLELLIVFGRDDPEGALAVYESFAAAYSAAQSGAPDWRERVASVRDGLASAYVGAGRHDDGDALFQTRHNEDRGDVAVALTASRSFLAAGEVSRAVHWLGIGEERAEALGRKDMAEKLREKAASLRLRLS